MRHNLSRLLIVLLLSVCLGGCASMGDTPRQKTAAVVNLVVGSPFYIVSYVSGLFLNVITYGTSWIWGDPDGDIDMWFTAAYGPNYATMNTDPGCWLYAGSEPANRALATTMPAGTHLRQIPIADLDYEDPPTFTFCRTGVKQVSLRGDESFPLR